MQPDHFLNQFWRLQNENISEQLYGTDSRAAGLAASLAVAAGAELGGGPFHGGSGTCVHPSSCGSRSLTPPAIEWFHLVCCPVKFYDPGLSLALSLLFLLFVFCFCLGATPHMVIEPRAPALPSMCSSPLCYLLVLGSAFLGV